MELLNYKQDVFGQSMLVGINYDLLWLPVVGAAVVIVLHIMMKLLRRTG
jgi:hypothetical protein